MKEEGKFFKVEKIEESQRLEELKEEWNALLKKNDTKTVELTYEWQITHWKYFNERSELFLFIVKDEHSIVGIAPLKLTHIKRFGIKIRCLEFLAAKDSNYQDFIIGNDKEGILQCIFQYLLYNKNSWDILRLANIPESSRTVDFLKSKLGRYFLCRTDGIQKCIFLCIDKPYEKYYSEIRGRRRKYVERCTRRLMKEGEVGFYHCRSEQEFVSNLNKLFEFHRKHWNHTDTPSEFNDKRYCDFYLESALRLFSKDEMDLSVLSFNKSAVSILLSFLYEKNYTLQLTAYDPSYKALSPSVVLWNLFIKDAFKNNIAIVDFGTYYPFKELWGDRLKNKISFKIYPKKIFPSYCLYILGKINSFLRDYLKKVPLIVRAVRYFRRKAGGDFDATAD